MDSQSQSSESSSWTATTHAPTSKTSKPSDSRNTCVKWQENSQFDDQIAPSHPQEGQPDHSWRDAGNNEQDTTSYNRIGSQYEYVKELRQCGEGRLFIVRHVPTRAIYARKSPSGATPDCAKNTTSCDRFLDPSLLQAVDLLELHTGPHVILDYCQGGDLSTFKKRFMKHSMQLPEAFLWSCFAQMVDAVDWIHNRLFGEAILHLDIKPHNFLVRREPRGRSGFEKYPQILLADFGLARHESDVAGLKNRKYGTRLY